MNKYTISCIFMTLLLAFIQSTFAEVPSAVPEEILDNLELQQEEKKITQEEKIMKRPDEWKGPTEVEFLGFIIDIDAIDDANQNFDANVFVALSWKDKRLANPEGKARQISLSDIWNPRVIVSNQSGRINIALPYVAEVSPDGTVVYRQRYTGKFSQPLDLSQFPLDRHEFEIRFAAAGFNENELNFIPNLERGIHEGGIADKISLPNWSVEKVRVESSPYQPIPMLSVPGFVIKFEAVRLSTYYLWQIIFPLTVVVMMSWCAFWLKEDQIGVRVGIATSSVLTLIAHRFVLASLLPKLPYMTKLDYFAVISTFMVLFALVLVVLCSWFYIKNRLPTAARIDLVSRAAFPMAFLGLLIWFIFL